MDILLRRKSDTPFTFSPENVVKTGLKKTDISKQSQAAGDDTAAPPPGGAGGSGLILPGRRSFGQVSVHGGKPWPRAAFVSSQPA